MKKSKMKSKFIEIAKKHIPNDWDKIDYEALIDESLTFEENKTKIMTEIQHYAVNPIEIDITELDRLDKIQTQQQRFQIELQAQEKFDKSIEVLKSSPPQLDVFYKPQYQIINALINSKRIKAMIIVGEAGLGKSHNTKKALALADKKFILINTYATPLELFTLLYEHRNNEVIVLDDIFKIFEDEVSLGILLSAMWEPCLVSYFSSTSKLKVPNQFEFNSKIILLCNQIPNKLRNVMSRCFVFRQDFNFQTKIKMIYELCKQENLGTEVADFIKNHTNQAYNIDLRLPFKIYDIKRNNDKWIDIALSQIENDERKSFIIEVSSSGKTIKEQVQLFTERFGLSRATYFNLKKELRL